MHALVLRSSYHLDGSSPQARGALEMGQRFVHESIVGTQFVGHLDEQACEKNWTLSPLSMRDTLNGIALDGIFPCLGIAPSFGISRCLGIAHCLGISLPSPFPDASLYVFTVSPLEPIP